MNDNLDMAAAKPQHRELTRGRDQDRERGWLVVGIIHGFYRLNECLNECVGAKICDAVKRNHIIKAKC